MRFLQLATSLRLQDVALRKLDRQERKEELQQKLLEREQREAKFATDEQEHMESLEQGVAYNPDEFMADWNERNPMVEIPPEVQEEDDFDVVEETN